MDTGPAAPLPQAIKRSLDGERLIAVLSTLVGPLGASLPGSSEIVLHDLTLLPNSIVAVAGDVTGRRVGDPATDLLLEQVMAGIPQDHIVGYRTRLPDGRQLRSSTMIIRDVAGQPVAALCINTDTTTWQIVQRIAEGMTGLAGIATADPVDPATAAAIAPALPDPAQDVAAPREAFVRDVDELAAHIIHQVVTETAIPVELMKKEHKIQVVRALQARGLFMLRDAVEMIAASLGVSRFTIYNYLNEIADQDDDPAGAGRGSGRTRKDPATWTTTSSPSSTSAPAET